MSELDERIARARAAGYTDEQIQAHLASTREKVGPIELLEPSDVDVEDDNEFGIRRPAPNVDTRVAAAKAAGYTEEQIQTYYGQRAAEMRAEGKTAREIDEHFGAGDPPASQELEEIVRAQVLQADPDAIADNPLEALDAGFQMSTSGIAFNGGAAPTQLAPEDSGLMNDMAYMVGQFAGDLPSTIAGAVTGGIGGASVGTAVAGPGPGTVVGGLIGGGAGSAALPEAIRSVYLDSLAHGEAANWDEVFTRAAEVVKRTGTEAIAGGVAAPIGGAIGGKLLRAGASKTAATLSAAAGEVVTYTSVGSGLRGQVPEPEDFIAGLLFVGGMHTGQHITSLVRRDGRPTPAGEQVVKNMKDVYRQTGVPPWELTRKMQEDPAVAQEILAGVDVEGNSVRRAIDRLRLPDPAAAASVPEDAFKKSVVRDGSGKLKPAYTAFEQGLATDATRDRMDPTAKWGPALYSAETGAAAEAHMATKAAKPKAPSADVPYDASFDEIKRFYRPGSVIQTANGTEKVQAFHDRGNGKWEVETFAVSPQSHTRLETRTRFHSRKPLRAQLEESGILEMPKGEDTAGTNTAIMHLNHQREIDYDAIQTAKEVQRIYDIAGLKRAPKDGMLGADVFDALTSHYGGDKKKVNAALEAAGYDGFTVMSGDIGGGVGRHPIRGTFDPANTRPAFRPENIVGQRGQAPKPPSKELTVPPGGGKKPPGGDEPLSDGPVEPDRHLPVVRRESEIGPLNRIDPETKEKFKLNLNEEMLDEIIMDIVGTPKTRSKLREALDPGVAYRQFINELWPAEKLDKLLGVEPGQIGVEDMMRQTYGSAGRASHFVRYGGVDPLTFQKTNDNSILSAFNTVIESGGTLKGFMSYRLAKRTVEKASQGVDTGIPLEHAKDKVRKGAKTYEAADKAINEVKNEVIDYAVLSGRLSEKQAKAIKAANKSHVTFRRILDPDWKPDPRGRGFRVGKGFRKMEGSEKQILDPNQADIENLHLMIAEGDRNRAIGSIIGAIEARAKADPAAIDVLPLKRLSSADFDVHQAVSTDVKLKEALEDAGMTPEDAAPLIARRVWSRRLQDNQFLYFREGKPEIWQAADPDLARMIRGAEPLEAVAIVEIAASVAKFQRAGITSTPEYAARMTVRDQVTASILDPHGGIPGHDAIRGIFRAFAKEDKYQEFLRNGGVNAALTHMDANYIQQDVNKLFESTGIAAKIWNRVRHPIEGMQLFAQVMDSSARLGFWRRRTEIDGISPQKAAMEARKRYLDFAQAGSSQLVQMFAKTVPFFRANLLGLDQLVRAMKDRPVTTTLRAATYITLPSVLLYELNAFLDQFLEEGDRYQDLPRWDRDLHWILPAIPMANGSMVRIRIPKPPVIGLIFGALPERALDWMQKDDPRAFKNIGSSIAWSFVPPFIPAIGLPVMEMWAGKRQFTGQQLIPASMEKLSGYMQYTENTTEIAKSLSKVLSPKAGIGLVDISPITLENFVRGWAGSVGVDALRILDAPFKQSTMPWNLSDLPIIRGFVVRHPTMNAAPIKDFFDEVKELEQASGDLEAAIRRNNDGEIDLATETMDAFIDLQAIREAIYNQYSTIVALNEDTEMTMDEKRQFIESAYSDMIATARLGLQTVDSLKEDEQ